MRHETYLRTIGLLAFTLLTLLYLSQLASAQGPPNGPAGGDLAGTYPNPVLAADRVRKVGDTMTGALNITLGTPGGALAYPFTLSATGNTVTDRGLVMQFNVPSNGTSLLGGQMKSAWGANGQTYLSFSAYNTGSFAEILRIDGRGRLGIGTTAPATQLHISNATAVATTLTAGYGGGLLSMQDTNGPLNSKLYQWRSEAGVFRMALLNDAWSGFVQQNILVANSVGNIGIGTALPAYRLDVSGEINATGIRINGTPIATGGASQWTGASNIYYNSGNVGVGTNNPAQLLHVQKDQNLDTNILSENPNAGASAQADVRVRNNIGTIGQLGVYSSGHSVYGALGAGDVHLYATSNLVVMSDNANGVIKFAAGGQAEKMRITSAGYVGIGTTTPTTTLHVQGDGKITGNLTVDGNIAAKYQDVAEWVQSSQQLSAGTVVVLDHTKSNQVIASSQAYDTRVAGVISLQPGITLGENGAGKVLVATTGRVKVKVDASAGAIQVGDLLVTSDREGEAKKSEPLSLGGVAIHRPGTLIGKALEPLEKGTGEILVLLSLQ